jgi:hypothetical protein
MKTKSLKYLFIIGIIIYIFLLLFALRILYEEIILTWRAETKLLVGYGFIHNSLFHALLILSIPFSIVWIIVFIIMNLYYKFKNSVQF